MKGYPVTEGQKNALIKPQKHNGMYFNPVQDINGVWFIFEVEAAFARDNFGWTLTEAEFIPPPPPDIDIMATQPGKGNK